LPKYEFELNENDQKFVKNVDKNLKLCLKYYENCQIRNAMKTILKISSLGNVYLQENAPWKQIKSKNQVDKDRAGQVIGIAFQIVVLLIPLIEPLMPNIAKQVSSQSGLPKCERISMPRYFSPMVASGHQIGINKPLIKAISDENIEIYRKKYGG